MPPGPWAMSVMMQKLHPSATPGANSVMSPAGVMRAILAGADVNSVPSVNQRLPSEPLVMARGWLLAVGTLNCFSAPTGAAVAALPSDKTSPTASVAASKRPALPDMSPTPELAAQETQAREPRRLQRGPGRYRRSVEQPREGDYIRGDEHADRRVSERRVKRTSGRAAQRYRPTARVVDRAPCFRRIPG